MLSVPFDDHFAYVYPYISNRVQLNLPHYLKVAAAQVDNASNRQNFN